MSKTIYQLDAHTINQIAAGEVIEDPSSIVKELVENSIDAGATHIIVKIKEGGKELIEIFDNGKGMSQQDMKVCYLKHTTSKIKTAHDISNISSMGFRGEALASICSVAKMTIQSKRQEDDYGYEVNLENSEIVTEKVCAFPTNGTKITVRDIFYNIPARRTFLDKEKTTKETKYIVDIVHRLNLANPQVSFELYINDQKILNTNGDKNMIHLLAEIYDINTAKNLLYFEDTIYDVRIRGYISKPEHCVGNKTKQSFFVNNRFVKMDILSTALRQGYNEYAVTKKYPVCVIFIDLPFDQVDINAHPRKTEIRFKHEIFPVVYSAVSKCLFKTKSIPSVSLTNNNQPHMVSTDRATIDTSLSHNVVKQNVIPVINDFEGNSVFEQKNNFEEDLSSLESISSFPATDTKNIFDVDEEQEEEFEQLQFEGFSQAYQNGFKDYNHMRVIGQVHDSYIIAQHETGIVMIDQHAAHERILFEKFLRSFNHKDIPTIESLIPYTIELSISDYLVVKENLSFFENYGFFLEDFGMKTIIVRKHPSIFKDSQIKNMVMTMIGEILKIENTSIVSDLIHKKIIMKSCKSAIKANMSLGIPEIEGLLNDLVKCENPYHCPHGRPIIFNISKYEIEKSFNRVV